MSQHMTVSDFKWLKSLSIYWCPLSFQNSIKLLVTLLITADTWPKRFDDSNARADWGWKHTLDLSGMCKAMFEFLAPSHQKQQRIKSWTFHRLTTLTNQVLLTETNLLNANESQYLLHLIFFFFFFFFFNEFPCVLNNIFFWLFVVTNFVLLLKTFILRWFHFICVEEINFSSEVLQNDVMIKNKISVYENPCTGDYVSQLLEYSNFKIFFTVTNRFSCEDSFQWKKKLWTCATSRSGVMCINTEPIPICIKEIPR